jgi:uncharacterized membrane protein
MNRTSTNPPVSAAKRLVVAFVVGLVAAAVCILLGQTKYAVLVTWDVMLVVYGIWVWVTVLGMSALETKSHAVRENPGRALADVLLVSASVASLIAVVVMLTQASSSSGAQKAIQISIGLISIVLSWGIVHTTYMLKYARLFYGQPEGGVNFNEDSSPRYTDFAYLAFTLGMTFQVSDTDLRTKEIRATALKHALLSYLFGTVIIATTINTLASLSQ